MNVLVRCMLNRGVFRGEWAVLIRSVSGQLSLLVDEYFVEFGGKPIDGEAVPGHLHAQLIGEKDEDAPLVQLPVHSSPQANRVRIPRQEIVFA